MDPYIKQLIIRLIFAIIIPFPIFYPILFPVTVYISLFLLRITGLSPLLVKDTIIIGETIITFIPACIAASAYYLLFILIMLTKDISFKTAFKLFFYGSALIMFMNIIRVYIAILVLMKFGVNYFDAIHIFFWLGISSFYVALVWILLTKIFKIKTIPVYSDIIYLYRRIRNK